jgi:hypothetical protein
MAAAAAAKDASTLETEGGSGSPTAEPELPLPPTSSPEAAGDEPPLQADKVAQAPSSSAEPSGPSMTNPGVARSASAGKHLPKVPDIPLDKGMLAATDDDEESDEGEEEGQEIEPQ